MSCTLLLILFARAEICAVYHITKFRLLASLTSTASNSGSLIYEPFPVLYDSALFL